MDFLCKSLALIEISLDKGLALTSSVSVALCQPSEIGVMLKQGESGGPGAIAPGRRAGAPPHFSLSCIGEGNGNPLQCPCLENPRDGEAWWAAVYGVAQSWTQVGREAEPRAGL